MLPATSDYIEGAESGLLRHFTVCTDVREYITTDQVLDVDSIKDSSLFRLWAESGS